MVYGCLSLLLFALVLVNNGNSVYKYFVAYSRRPIGDDDIDA